VKCLNVPSAAPHNASAGAGLFRNGRFHLSRRRRSCGRGIWPYLRYLFDTETMDEVTRRRSALGRATHGDDSWSTERLDRGGGIDLDIGNDAPADWSSISFRPVSKWVTRLSMAAPILRLLIRARHPSAVARFSASCGPFVTRTFPYGLRQSFKSTIRCEYVDSWTEDWTFRQHSSSAFCDRLSACLATGGDGRAARFVLRRRPHPKAPNDPSRKAVEPCWEGKFFPNRP